MLNNGVAPTNGAVKIYVGGPQGVGKTTLINAIANKYGIPCFTSSQVFMHYFGVDKEGLEGINEASPDLINEVFGDFYAKNKSFILDGHFNLADSATEKTFDVCLFLYAEPELILSRKKRDKTRVRRDNGSAQLVAKEMHTKLTRACKFSDSVFVIDAEESELDTLAKVEQLAFIAKTSPKENGSKVAFAQDLMNYFLSPKIEKREYEIGEAYNKNDRMQRYDEKKSLSAFTKGSFDCVHMGHFFMLCCAKVNAAKILHREVNDINLTAVLSQQDGGKFKGVEYAQGKGDRANEVLKTGVVNNIAFCDDTKFFVLQNMKDIDVFVFGADQNNKYFKGVEEICVKHGIKTCRLENRYGGVSSTKIRQCMAEEGVGCELSREKIETSTTIEAEGMQAVKKMIDSGLVTLQNAKHFHVDRLLKSADKRRENFRY